MAQQNRTTIKTFFETGDIPTQAQFGDSFDSQVFWVDDVETTLGNTDTKVPTSKAVNDAIAASSSWASTLVSTSQTATNSTQYIVVANATFTDPTPVEGKGFKVYVRNGTATVGGTAYSVAGSVIWRVFHSGSWANYYSSPFNDATSSIQTQLNSKTDTFTLLSIIGTWASPADSLSYYGPIIGGVTTPITTVTTFLSSFSFATKIIGIYVQHINNVGTQGSSENVAFQIRNNTTSTSTQLINIQTNQASGAQKNFEDYSLNISIAANDQIALQINTPAWATNPTNAIFRVSLFIQRT